jgi:hypothetical protein
LEDKIGGVVQSIVGRNRGKKSNSVANFRESVDSGRMAAVIEGR